MTHKILAIADASRDTLNPMMDALQITKKERLSMRIILLSFLSVLSRKHFEPLGPNTLFLLMKEEQDILQEMRNRFKTMDIPCSLRLITSPVWKEIFDEMENGDQDLILLQGRFLKMWNQSSRDFGLCSPATYKPEHPVLMVKHSKGVSMC